MKTVSAVVKFSPSAMKKIKPVQRKLKSLDKPSSKSAAANYIIEKSADEK